MNRILIVGYQGLVGRAIHAATLTEFQVEGVTSADSFRPTQVDFDLIINAGGRIWGNATSVEHDLMSSAEAAIFHANRSRCPILHIGSCVEYGTRKNPVFLSEESTLHPQTKYAKAKVKSWNRITSEATHGALSLRSGLILSRSISSNSLLGRIRDVASKKNQVFQVPESVLGTERTPIHIDDFSSAVLAVIKRLFASNISSMPSILNCGGGEAISVCDLANQVLSFYSLSYRYPKPSKISQYELLDISQLESVANWKPTHTIRKGDWLK